jgi:hypothetical protein
MGGFPDGGEVTMVNREVVELCQIRDSKRAKVFEVSG